MGAEGRVDFQVVAKDKLAHAQQADAAAPFISLGSLGIDGHAPTVNFTLNYPVDGTDCDNTLPGGATDNGIVCGHDGSHWWRRGLGTNGAELTNMTFTATDLGSGMDPGTGTCLITGSSFACT